MGEPLCSGAWFWWRGGLQPFSLSSVGLDQGPALGTPVPTVPHQGASSVLVSPCKGLGAKGMLTHHPAPGTPRCHPALPGLTGTGNRENSATAAKAQVTAELCPSQRLSLEMF